MTRGRANGNPARVHLSPRDLDKLILHGAGVLAQKRLARGLRLNYPEAVALIASQLLELVRDGHSVSELMDLGRHMLGRAQVLPGVASMIHDVQIEGTFADGTKLVTVHEPISRMQGDLELALRGSFLPMPKAFPDVSDDDEPGAIRVKQGTIAINEGRDMLDVRVKNNGDRPIQVGSHYPFDRTNSALDFDRGAVKGYRLDIPAGTAVRFEPGDEKTVRLVSAP